MLSQKLNLNYSKFCTVRLSKVRFKEGIWDRTKRTADNRKVWKGLVEAAKSLHDYNHTRAVQNVVSISIYFKYTNRFNYLGTLKNSPTTN